jgi:amino acid transporter
VDSVVSILKEDGLIPDWREDAFKTFLVHGAAGRLIAFWECSCRSIFVYTGAEMLGIAAEETERQRETLPKAVRRVSHRIIFNYVGLIFVLGLNLSSNDPILGKRLSGPYYPGAFITMVQRANLPELAPIINVVMIIAAVSVANADIYVGVRYTLTNLIFRVVLYLH